MLSEDGASSSVPTSPEMPSALPPPRPPPFRSVTVTRSILHQIRTLLLCSASQTEHLANLHLTLAPSFSISTLSLSSTLQPTAQTVRFIPLTPAPTTPRRSPDLTLPLSASVALTSSSVTLSLHATIRTFHYALDAPTSFSVRDSRVLAQTALAIVLAGGGCLREGERMGGLRRREVEGCLEAVGAEEDGDAGVWVLVGGEWELWEALAGFAERVARRRNKKLGQRSGGGWVSREVVVVIFEERGEAHLRKGWLRVLCGKDGMENWRADVVGGPNEGVGKFVREGSSGGASRANALRSSLERLRLENSRGGAGERNIGERGMTSGRSRERTSVDMSREEQSCLLFGGDRDEDRDFEGTGDELERILTQGIRPREETVGNDGDTAEVNIADEEETMNVMCLKYLNSSYAEEIRRRMDPVT